MSDRVLYQCRCRLTRTTGDADRWPPPCMRCPRCNSTLASREGAHLPVIDHDFHNKIVRVSGWSPDRGTFDVIEKQRTCSMCEKVTAVWSFDELDPNEQDEAIACLGDPRTKDAA